MISPGYTFDQKKLQKIEGFPQEAKLKVESELQDWRSQKSKEASMSKELRAEIAEMTKLKGWTTQSYGMFAEYKVIRMLERVFSSQPCCLVNSFQETQLVKVARETLDPEAYEMRDSHKGKRKHDAPLSARVRNIKQNKPPVDIIILRGSISFVYKKVTA